jgi:hypothetical protein
MMQLLTVDNIEPPPPPPIVVSRRDPKLVALVAFLCIVVIGMAAYIVIMPHGTGIVVTSDNDAVLLAGEVTNSLQQINQTLSDLEMTMS